MTIVTYGTQSATVTTKHQLYTTTSEGVYVLGVDTNALQVGDTVELYIDVAYEAGGTKRQTFYVSHSHVQADPGKISVPVVAPYGATFHLKQTVGTGRSFPWYIASV